MVYCIVTVCDLYQYFLQLDQVDELGLLVNPPRHQVG